MKAFAEFRMPQTVYYGRDSFSKIEELIPTLGKKVLIISDRIMEKIGNVDSCLRQLDNAKVAYITYLDVNTEPTDIHVQESLELFQQEKCDVIIAIGGGSCIDAAKAVAVLATNGGYIGDYMGGKTPIPKAPIPFIAVPTTAGTGAEVTSVTVITNTTNDVKMMIKHPAFIPAVAIVDPILTMTSPQPVTAATGVDALCHSIEAYISRKAQPMTDALALTSIRLISQNLRQAYQNGDDVDARENMALASMQAGVAFSNASVCLIHGMSRPIGALFHVPHGVSNAMLLPAVLEFSKDDCVERLAVIGRIFNSELNEVSDEEAAEGAVQEIKQLCLDLSIPNMNSWGLDKAIFDQLVDKMATDALDSGSPGNNPRVPRHSEIVELYQYCYNYQFENVKGAIK
jgi:alcohol dehydrogenase class IV